jgi:hypothetical protein
MRQDSTFTRCANPDCGASFDYRQGQLFRFPQSHGHRKTRAGSHSVKHLWLCKACSEIYTLVYRAGFGVLFESRFPRPSDHHEVRLITAA